MVACDELVGGLYPQGDRWVFIEVNRNRFMNRKQEVFIREYLVDMNGAEAAKRAGYAPGSAAGTAWRILRMPEVKALIGAELEKRRQSCEVSGKRVRESLADIAFAPAEGAAVGHKIRCLELLAKMLGLFEGGSQIEPVSIVEDV